MALHPSDVLVRPVITEKNTNLTPLGQYTFEVAPDANKIMVKEAVEQIFGVKVRAVNILIVKPKKKRILRSRNFREFGFRLLDQDIALAKVNRPCLAVDR